MLLFFNAGMSVFGTLMLMLLMVVRNSPPSKDINLGKKALCNP